MATAARLFEERGYHETSLADIAAALGVTKPTLYYYVANKEDIVGQIIERALESVQACADLARAQERTGLERLRAFARGYAEGMSTDSGRCLLALRRVPIGRAARARNSAGYRRIDALGRDLIAEGIADGSIRRCDVKLAAFALFGALNAIPDWFHPNEPLSAPEVGDAIFELFARGLGASSPDRKE